MIGWNLDKNAKDLSDDNKPSRADLNMQDNHGRTALHWAICPTISADDEV